ncbi:hypothetical protein IGI04_032560 [Brassica rapa subsp. trilocularis]|uniref:Uncharacterized protein n=1 Tax=Brassica rapa subsp. trilocularis TaxID=1813537 RepID=A0ABQ7M062_BRACM|nr:hypothetical protein IGI04_032560 [Brassica rapa subsp. trilocularis]
MSSNRGKMVPGSDDQFVIVWNKQTLHFESEQGKKLFSTESFLKRLFRSSNQSPETMCKLTVSCMVKGHIFTVTVFDSSTCSLCIVPILFEF